MFHVEQAWVEALQEGAGDLQLRLTPTQIEQFQQYLEELISWNERMNLTAITDRIEIAIKHFVDSLAGLKVLLPGPLLDVGSGAGFPGVPLKIADPSRDVTLLEPSHKKTAFLHHLVGTLHLQSVRVVTSRLEELAKSTQPPRFPNIVSRALDLTAFLPLVPPLLTPQGRVILYRSAPATGSALLSGPGAGVFRIADEVSYSLPRGYGARVLTVITAA